MNFRLLVTVLSLLLGIGQLCHSMKRPFEDSEKYQDVDTFLSQDIAMIEQYQDFDTILHDLESNEKQQETSKKQRIKDIHPDEKKMFGCLFCSKSFASQIGLKGHENNVHKEIKQHICSDCGKSFAFKNHLKYHEDNVHKKIKHICSDCGKSFTSKSNLKCHKDHTHPEIDNVIQFNENNEIFGQEEQGTSQDLAIIEQDLDFDTILHNLESNEKQQEASKKQRIKDIHSGEKKMFGCSLCSKSFTSKGNLKRHKDRTHKEIKYSCSVCNKSYCSEDDLKQHKDSAHTWYTCNYPHCNKSFVRQKRLMNHIAEEHVATIASDQTPQLTAIATPLISLLSASTPDLAVGSQDKNNQDVQGQEKSEHYSEHYADMPEIDNLI